jgi:micrococcal nuclease
MYEYRCKVVYIVDGDTVDVDIDLGFDVWLKDQRIRINGIDAPESRTSDPIEKIFGLAAKQRVSELVPLGSDQVLQTFKDGTGKYGRILGDFVITAEDGSKTTLTNIMLTEGHAVLYNGKSKSDIEAAHLRNRQLLVEAGMVKLD